MKLIRIHSDGGYRINLGFGAYAFIIIVDGVMIAYGGDVVKEATSNRCEYMAVVEAIKKAGDMRVFEEGDSVEVWSDSQLLVNQVNRVWKTNDMDLMVLQAKIDIGCKSVFPGCDVRFYWNSRESQYTKMCDKICDDLINKEAMLRKC